MSKSVKFALLQGGKFIRDVMVEGRMSVGSTGDCKIPLDDPGFDGRFGVLFELKGKIYIQPEDAGMVELTPNDAFAAGTYTLVRVDAGRFAKTVKDATPGQDLGYGDKEPFSRVVTMTKIGTKKVTHETGQFRPKGFTQGSPEAAPGIIRAQLKDGQTHYDCEPMLSAKVDRTVATFIKMVENKTTDAGELERNGTEFLETMRQMAFPEIVSVLKQFAKAQRVNYLELLYEQILIPSPMLSFRFAMIIAERYAAAARGRGLQFALPKLKIDLDTLVNHDMAEAFKAARTNGGKAVNLNGGPW